MSSLFFLIPISLVLLSLAIWAFFWAVKNDQFEDLDGPAYSILFDDEEEIKKTSHSETTSEDSTSDSASDKEPKGKQE